MVDTRKIWPNFGVSGLAMCLLLLGCASHENDSYQNRSAKEIDTTSSDMKKGTAPKEETLVLKQDTACYQHSPQQGFPPMILTAGTKVRILEAAPIAGHRQVRTENGQKCYMQ
jgi:hypothetical protein